MVGSSGPRSTPSGCVPQLARASYDDRCGAGARAAGSGWCASAAAASSRACSGALRCEPRRDPLGQLAVDLPVVHRALGLGEDRGAEARGVAHGETVEDQVVVVALEGRRRRQDHVGVAGRLVEVDVDRGHEVERVEGPAEPRAVGGREHRVAGDADERLDLPVAGRLDLLAHARRRAAPRRTPGGRGPGCGRGRSGRSRRTGARRRRRPARGTSPRPARSKSPARRLRQLIAHWLTEPKPVVETPEPAVRRRAVGVSHSSRASRSIVAAGTPLTCSASAGVKSSTSAAQPLEPVDVRRWPAPGPRRGACAASRAARPRRRRVARRRARSAIAAVSVRRGSSTTIRPPRCLIALARFGKSGVVISEPLEAIGLAPSTRRYDVRSRSGIGQQQLVAEHLPGDQLVRHLVDRRGAEAVARAQRLHERARAWVAEPSAWALGLPR